MHIDQFQYFIIYSYLAPTLGWIKRKKITFLFLNLIAFFWKIFCQRASEQSMSLNTMKLVFFLQKKCKLYRLKAHFPNCRWEKFSSIITGIIWYTNMAALLLFWHKKYCLCDYMWKTSYDAGIKQKFRIQIVLTGQLV